MGLVEIERSGPVARVWLARPERHNALTGEAADALTFAFESLAAEPGVRVVVLGGRGPSFCAGADLEDMKAAGEATQERNLAEATRLARTFATVAGCPKPVVGRIHGHVLGGGVGLCCACDIPVAAGDARFGLTEVRLGLLPGVISPYVVRRIGEANARELMLTGERIGAEAAHRLGLVQHVVFPAELDDKVDERVGALLAGGPAAQARIKALLARRAAAVEPDEDFPRLLAETRAGDEAREGLAAFLEKRKPRWAT